MMAHGNKSTSGYLGGVTEVMCLRPNTNVHSPAVERLGTRRKADLSGWLKRGAREVNTCRTRDQSSNDSNGQHEANTFPQGEGALYNEARVNIRKSACVAVSSRLWRHHPILVTECGATHAQKGRGNVGRRLPAGNVE